MKLTLSVGAAVALMVLAGLFFGGRGEIAPPPVAADAPAPAPEDPPPLARPRPEDVVAVVLGEGEGAVRLVRKNGGWVVGNLDDMPANGAKIERLLASVLTAHAEPVPAGTAGTGLENGGGLRIFLRTGDGGEYAPVIGLRPRGEYRRTYARFPGGRAVMLDSDVRGDLGEWKNRDGAVPNPADWMDRVVLRFNPEDASGVLAVYPDHRIQFVRDAEYVWHAEGYVPGGYWERSALTAWINDLSEFQVAGAISSASAPGADAEPSHSLEIRLPDGPRRLRVFPNHAGGEGMLVESDDYPGRAFHLPEWRFRKYFRRLPSLFPSAVPAFDMADIRFMDIRRGGETVKISRRDGTWRAVALPYPLLAGRVERLARLLAAWHPEDYAAPDFRAVHPNYGGPMIELILANGDVHQYRLAGRHPLFPWRYVALDGKAVYSVTDSEAEAMFPDFADIMNLGLVFGALRMDEVSEIGLAGEDRDKPLLVVRRTGENAWTAESGGHVATLDGGKGWRIVNDLLSWPVAGFFNAAAAPVKRDPVYYVYVLDLAGNTRSIAVLSPDDRDVPYLEEGGRALVVDRNDFFGWLAEARRMMDDLEKEAGREAVRLEEEAREAARAEARAAADREAEDLAAFEAALEGVPPDLEDAAPDDAGPPAAGEETPTPEEIAERAKESLSATNAALAEPAHSDAPEAAPDTEPAQAERPDGDAASAFVAPPDEPADAPPEEEATPEEEVLPDASVSEATTPEEEEVDERAGEAEAGSLTEDMAVEDEPPEEEPEGGESAAEPEKDAGIGENLDATHETTDEKTGRENETDAEASINPEEPADGEALPEEEDAAESGP